MLRANNTSNTTGQTTGQTTTRRRVYTAGDIELRSDAIWLEQYAEQAREDFDFYRWLERRGALPPPGKQLKRGLKERYHAERRQALQQGRQ